MGGGGGGAVRLGCRVKREPTHPRVVGKSLSCDPNNVQTDQKHQRQLDHLDKKYQQQLDQLRSQFNMLSGLQVESV